MNGSWRLLRLEKVNILIINKSIFRNILNNFFSCLWKASNIYKKLIILLHVETFVTLSTYEHMLLFYENNVNKVPLIFFWYLLIYFLFFKLLACIQSLLIRFRYNIRILLKVRNVSTLNRPWRLQVSLISKSALNWEQLFRIKVFLWISNFLDRQV